MTFEELAKNPTSEKVTLVTCEAEQLVKLFDSYEGVIYKRKVNYFVTGVKESGVSYFQVFSINDLLPGKFFYETSSQNLFIICLDASHPKSKEISIVYRFFFSNAPLNLPHDLASGEVVEWLPIVNSIGNVGQQLSDESTGLVLESSSNVSFLNNEGFFDEIYDIFLWENKLVTFYIWFPETDLTQAKKVFEGVIDSKDFGLDTVRFNVKDFVYKLKDVLKLDLFSNLDGRPADSLIGTPKRRIYGQVKQARLAGIDNILKGFNLTGKISISAPSLYLTGTASGVYISNNLAGTVSGTINSNILTGVGTSFLSSISTNQKIKITNGILTYTYTVLSVQSNTSLTLTSRVSVGFSGFSAINSSQGNRKIYGDGTKFLSEIQKGSNIRFFSGGIFNSYEVESIQTDTELTITDYLTASFSGFSIFNEDIKNIVVKGEGTQFLKELSPEDEIELTWNGKNYEFKIDTVVDDTTAMVTESSEESIIKVDAKIRPNRPYRYLNRRWHLSGHKLRAPSSTITFVRADNRFIIGSTKDLYVGDRVLINGDFVTIRRISGNELIMQNSISPIPQIGDLIQKIPIQKIYFKNRELIWGRDWDFQNGPEAIITLNDLAEFNITQEKLLGVNITFTNGSNIVTTSATVDLRSILNSRDFIRKNSIVSGENNWYEILEVGEQTLILRSNFSGTSSTTSAQIKTVDYIQDDSLLAADALGLEENGEWVRTPSEVVKHLIQNDAGLNQINEASFIQAKADCDYTTSIVLPEQLGGKSIPTIRDSITKINESVFGSLYGDSSLNISYSILNSTRPDDTPIIREDDILSYDSSTRNEIYNKIICKYRPFTDLENGEDSFEIASYNSGHVDKYLGIKNTLNRTLYLFESDKAEIISQRLALFYSMPTNKINIKGKMLFFLNSVNDKLSLSFERLFKRFGGGDRRKFGIITGIKKGQTEVEVELSDLGNIFNRVATVSPNTAPDFTEASEEERLKYSFVVDNETLTPNVSSEEGISCNLIG